MTMARWIALLLTLLAVPAAAESLPLARLDVPPGFAVELFARVPNARQMALGERTLFVGSMRAGKVYAVPLQGTRTPRVVAENLNLPVGVAFRDGDLYVSAVDRVLRLRDVEAQHARPPRPEVVARAWPTDTHHGWKFIAFGPDGKLYVPVGAPCNICEPDPGRHAVITRLDVGRGTLEVVARGVRNTVGFDWHPRTGELWFTDNGRDWMGDDAPPDELNRLRRPGLHFGYPYCHGGTLADPEFGARARCEAFEAPVQNLGAHVAALGMRFYTGRQFPARYRGAIFIAEHGSWNRSRKAGYRVSVVRFDGERVIAYEPFVTGWLQDETAWGRPADVLGLPDGSLLVSDDHAGAIYRIVYRGSR
jgi:glucose/arabinose dehydrogenase